MTTQHHDHQHHNHHELPLVKTDALTSGDKKAALDSQTGLIWLNFGVNRAQSFNDVMNSLETTYKNWRLPTLSEVNNLWGKLEVFIQKNPAHAYDLFKVWGANKAPADHLPFSCYGYFLNEQKCLSHLSFLESGTQIATANPNYFYTDGKISGGVQSTGGQIYTGADVPPFNFSGTEEISTLLVKNPKEQNLAKIANSFLE